MPAVKADYQKVSGLKKPTQQKISTQCTETFIKAGGQHEILASTWEQPTRYPRIGLAHHERAGRAGQS